MRFPDVVDLLAQAEAEATDGVIRKAFGAEPQVDRSGLFTGQPSLPSARPTGQPDPAPVSGRTDKQVLPELHQGERPLAPAGDDPAMDAYMQRFWPQAARGTP